MNCPDCNGKLAITDTRSSDYVGRQHTCSIIAHEIGGSNCVGRIRECVECGVRYVSVETLETRLIKRTEQKPWDE